MIIVALCVFLGDSARGIYFPTMWLNVQRCGGNQAIQGMVVASFSLGRIITSPYLGALSEKMGHKFVLTISNSVILLGCFLYANASSIPSLIISQIIVGFGSGTLGVTRSYVAETSPKEHRTSYMAYLTATQYTGFTVMPLLGGYLALYGKKLCSSGNCKWLIFEMNEFSFPAYFMMAMAAIIIFLVVFVFQDYKKDPTSASSTKKKTISEIEAAKETDTCESCGITGMTLANELAIGGCLLNIATKGNIGVYETLGMMYAEGRFDWASYQAGAFFAASGFIGVLILLCFKQLTAYFGDFNLMLYGILLMVVSNFLMVQYMWEDSLPEWQFVLGVPLMYCIAYPVGHTAVLGVFSKIVSNGPQGELQGWFGSAGSLARVIFPLTAGLLTHYFYQSSIFVLANLILSLAVAGILIWKPKIDKILAL
jgi:ceroid-lipofuscinosis MFS transporter 7